MKMMGTGLLGALLTVCFLAFLTPVAGSLQQITFYELDNCVKTGFNDTITNTNNALNTSRATNATSMFIVGVWVIHVQNNATTNKVQHDLIFDKNGAQLGRCINKSAWNIANWQTFTIYAAKRIGPPDMTTSQLIVFSEVNFNGTSRTIIGDLSDLGSLLRVRSYAHFSDSPWTLFPEKGYFGTERILRTYTEGIVDNFAFSKSANYVVGSVRKGMHVGSTTTTLRPGPSNSTTRTTTPSTPKPGKGNGSRNTGSFQFMLASLILAIASILA